MRDTFSEMVGGGMAARDKVRQDPRTGRTSAILIWAAYEGLGVQAERQTEVAGALAVLRSVGDGMNYYEGLAAAHEAAGLLRTSIERCMLDSLERWIRSLAT